MVDMGLKVLNKLKEISFRSNYLNYFSRVLSPKTVIFEEKIPWKPLSASQSTNKEIEKSQIYKKHRLQL